MSTNSRQESSIRALLAYCLGCDEQNISPEADLVNQLYADSLDLLDLAMALHDEFNIELTIDDMLKIKKVGDLYQVVQDKIGAETLSEQGAI
ncbi:phosphopantetheine-binding protein [Iodobacter fluviatilis]|uniref:Acyl carrier protein n=1 Tax=Iodobacter fluviatilis TaxID=537 RepID=A0A377Q4T2_9NEIS|nr:phosphopantetheine-binding protein [Iodobacter fluviatilis]TCU86903.1 acyl carrier protein [Iodobacter fluviatilis]STQ90234.1 Acyl carrier protein [Iodobacter fluviatilis]